MRHMVLESFQNKSFQLTTSQSRVPSNKFSNNFDFLKVTPCHGGGNALSVL